MVPSAMGAPEGLDGLRPEGVVRQVAHGCQRLAPIELHRIRREPCIPQNINPYFSKNLV